MMHSQLPVPSLLCILLMLPLGIPKGFSDVPVTDASAQKVVAFAMEQFNKKRHQFPNYFKKVRFVKAKSQEVLPVEYLLDLEVVKTACKKETGKEMPYKRIQQCKYLPGNRQLQCRMQVKSGYQLKNMNLTFTYCI